MTRRAHHSDQLDLLGWQPEEAVEAFAPHTVRAASLAATVSKGISQALKACGRRREDVARLMSEFLDDTVSEAVLNAYASEAKSDHIINLVRFIALIEVTRDRRLLQLIAERMGWAVVDARYLSLIEIAQLEEHRSKVEKQIDAVRRQAKRGGVL